MKLTLNTFYTFSLIVSIVGVISFIFDFGYSQETTTQKILDVFFLFVLLIGIIATSTRYYETKKLAQSKVVFFDVLTIAYSLWIFYLFIFVGTPFKMDLLLENPFWVKIAVFFTFIRELSQLKINYKQTVLNPGQLFIVSFLVIILIGAFLLQLPNATYKGISFIDALFTATSAVCVTGLIVVDTGTHFTQFGQYIILALIQIGGIGILTIASYFSYFFKGKTSYENQLVMGDMTSSKKLSEVFSTLKHIIVITAIIEFFTALLVYVSIYNKSIDVTINKVFFAVFHSISAFCNAGFSTLYNGLYDTAFKFNYFLQITLIVAFVLGGLGFPIVYNTINYLKYKLVRVVSLGRKKVIYKPWVLSLNSRITLITTFAISILATIAFYFIEYHNTLTEHTAFGKIVTAIFGATTPRTAGFNTINPADMLLPTTLIVILLMWIGASPASTGGGIKTSTFAIIVLNILSVVKGKSRIEIFRREISENSVKRAFAMVSLSLIVIGLGILSLSIFEPDKNLKDIAFECFSAYSTVGLSLGITANLTFASKFVIILLMFIGRVSMLTVMISLFKKSIYKNYRYPTEEVTIN